MSSKNNALLRIKKSLARQGFFGSLAKKNHTHLSVLPKLIIDRPDDP
jgi:uncharacterized protein YcgL (UPF0745 family)